MPPVMFSVVTKYHKGRHSLFLYNSEIFYACTQDILRSLTFSSALSIIRDNVFSCPSVIILAKSLNDKSVRVCLTKENPVRLQM